MFKPLGIAAAAVTLPGSAELLMLTLGGVLPARPPREGQGSLTRLAVVIPAHNEEDGISECVRSVQRAQQPSAELSLIVIADNCTDSTATVAAEAGAEVWERTDLVDRGKGFALAFAFSRLLDDPDVDAVLVVDADTDVADNFLVACESAFAAGADAVQVAYHIQNPEASTRARLGRVAFLAFNVLRPRGRNRFGLSAGILGNGWGMSRACLEAVPYRARSVVEDLEHHIDLVQAGYRVEFLASSSVQAAVPDDDGAADTQRARWEGGRLRMIRERVPGLLSQAMRRQPRVAEPAFELMLLPLAYHVAILGVTLLIPFRPSRRYALAGLGLVGAHVAGALAVGGGNMKDVKALASAPGYMLWKARVLPRIVAASVKDQEWVRTGRASGTRADTDE